MTCVRNLRRILVVRQENKLGDVLMATPVLEFLKRAVPDIHITVLTHRSQHPVLRHNKSADALWHTRYKPTWREVPALLWQIREGCFDVALLLRYNSGTHTILSWLAGIPVRVGNADKYYARLLTVNLREPLSAARFHWVEYSLQMAQRITGCWYDDLRIVLPIPERDDLSARDLLKTHGLEKGGYFCVHPGTGGSAHPWYACRFGEAAAAISRQTGLRVVVTGTGAEAHLAAEVGAQLYDGVDLTGRTSLPQLAAIVRGARMVLSGDTGIVHVAASTNTPCVIVHTGSDYELKTKLFHPWKTPYRTVRPREFCAGCTPQRCSNTGEVCLRSIAVEDVVETAMELLNSCSL
jgi:ADP-heptose:LPS heptosyltransferase